MKFHPFVHRALSGVVAMSLLALAGCGGSNTSAISGKIKLKGKEPGIEGLQISFLGASGVPTTLPIQPDGSYSGQAPIGEVHVGFSWVPSNSEAALDEYARIAKPVGEEIDPKTAPKDYFAPDKVKEREAVRAKGEAAIRFQKSPLPPKLEDPRLTGIKTTVTPGAANSFDHDIK